MSEFLSIDVSQISFACLFVWLLLDTNKKNEQREEKYQNIIAKFFISGGEIVK